MSSSLREAEWAFAVEACGGADRQRAMRFLLSCMPPRDRASLPVALLLAHVELAFEARETFPWCRKMSETMFFRHVLPYAVFDETREEWRKMMRELVAPLVADCGDDVGQAVARVNQRIWNVCQVHYSTERRAPNQCISESMASHKASCTGLTILLVCALRSVGIAARAVGTPLWAKGTGNHTWVEFHDGNDWHFTGASEQDPAGHDRGWFVSEAAKAIPNSRHAIYATLWDRHHEGATFFPMVWSVRCKFVDSDHCFM